MLYLENPPSYVQLEELLAWERTFASESEVRRARNPFLHKLGRLPKAAIQALFRRDKLLALAKKYFASGPILDVGCAGGHTLAGFPAEYIPCGIEVSTELSGIAAERFGVRGGFVIQSDALSGLRSMPEAYFTGVIMTSFLEHETNPREVLLATQRVLRRRASLIIKVPNFASWNRTVRGRKWCGFRFPDHVNYFTPELLVRLLESTGFEIVRFLLVDRLPTSDTMWLVARAPSSAGGSSE
jgi:SAM-dependent methyltransferase